MFRGYFRLGGTEIVNSERTFNYVKKNMPLFGLEDCNKTDGQLHLALGHKEYESPLADDAPWVDEHNPATYDFYGFYPLGLTGSDDDTREAVVTQGILAGGTVGEPRAATREMRYRGAMIARTQLGLQAGISWLKAALSPAPCGDHGGSCTGATACLYAAPPVVASDCFEPEAGPAVRVDTGSISPSTPFSQNFRNGDTRKEAWFEVPITDGAVLRWGAESSTDGTPLESFGPIISRRSNYLPNPSFTTDVATWLFGGRTLTRVATGGVDNEPYARAAMPALELNGDFSAVTPGAVTFRQNLNINPHFVGTNGLTSGSAAGWTSPAGNGSFTGDGIYDLSTTMTGTLLPYEQNGPAVAPGTEITVQRTFAVPVGSPALTLRLGLVPYSSGGSLSSTYNPEGFVTIQPGTSRTLFARAVMPNGTITVRSIPYVQTSTQPAGARLVMTNASIEPVSYDRPFFSGATPDMNGWDYGWSGAENLSSSTAKSASTGGYARRNEAIAPNPVGTNGWNANGPTIPAVTDSVVVRRPGTTSKRGDQQTPGSTQAISSLYNVGALSSAIAANPAVVPNQIYDFSLYAMSTETNSSHQFRYEWFTAASVAIGTAVVVTPAPFTAAVNEWQRFSTRTAAAPALAAFVRVSSIITTANSLASVTAASHGWVTDFLVETSSAIAPVLPYFDGGTGQLDEMMPAWLGTVGQAVSVLNMTPPMNAAGSNIAVGQSQKWAASGTRSMRLVANSADVNSFAYVNGLTNIIGTLAAGVTYRLRATMWMAGPQAAPGTGARRAFLATNISNQSSPQLANAAGAQALDWTFTVPAGSTNGTLRLYSGSAKGDQDVFWDLVSLVAIDAPGSIRTADLNTQYGAITGSFALAAMTAPVVVSVVSVTDNAVQGTTTIPAHADWQTHYVHSPYGRQVYLAFESAGEFSIDQVRVGAGEVELPYFDGSKAYPFSLSGVPQDLADYDITWDGPANNSTSRMTWNGGKVGPQGQAVTPGHQFLMIPERCEELWRVVLTADAGALPHAVLRYVERQRVSNEDQAVPFERNFHDVTVVAGPTVISEYAFTEGAVLEFEFTFVAGTPFIYGSTIDLLEYEKFVDLPHEPWTDVACAVEDNSPILDPDCPPQPTPPRPPAVPNVCVADPGLWERYYLTIPGESISGWSQMVPTIVLNTGAEDVRQVRVRFTPNPFGWTPDAVDPCAYCSEFILSYLPARAELTVDGLTERAFASVAGGSAKPASQLLYGTDGAPMSWASLSCGIDYVMTVDVPPTDVANVSVSLSLTVQE